MSGDCSSSCLPHCSLFYYPWRKWKRRIINRNKSTEEVCCGFTALCVVTGVPEYFTIGLNPSNLNESSQMFPAWLPLWDNKQLFCIMLLGVFQTVLTSRWEFLLFTYPETLSLIWWKCCEKLWKPRTFTPICKSVRLWKVHFSSQCEQGHHFTITAIRSCKCRPWYNRVDYSRPAWGKINMAISDPILADLRKSRRLLRADDDRLPALLPNLDTDTEKRSASSISGVPAGSTIM